MRGKLALPLVAALLGLPLPSQSHDVDHQRKAVDALIEETAGPPEAPNAAKPASAVPPPDDEAGPAPVESAPVTLKPLLIEGRADDQIGVARSGSEGAVGAEQLETRPVLRNAELLEVIPGLLATQHSGSGKANQYFLRGFNLDHGSDFAVRVDGVPMNLPTHAHGQGYLDLNGIIPELVRTVRYNKGPYLTETGDFSAAGSAYIQTFDRLERGFFQVGGGMHGFGRALVASSSTVAGGDLLYAGEVQYYEGPWKLDEDAIKGNALVKWTRGDHDRGVQLYASAYTADWTATDQIPLNAVRDGRLPRLGFVDPTDGGDTSRYTVSASAWRSGEQSHTRAQLYGAWYELDLFSNFTYFLDDETNGDQFHQRDRRGIFGGDLVHDGFGEVWGFTHESRVGISLRHDSIPTVALRRTRERDLLDVVRSDEVEETSLGLWGDTSVTLVEKLRATAGLRLDGYRFGTEDKGTRESASELDGIVSPKIGLIAGPWVGTEAYFNFGTGFHSNDARGVTSAVMPADPLVRSYGYEIGLRNEAIEGLHTSVALWLLDLDSELVFVGDAGDTEAGDPSRRYGIEWSNYYEPTGSTAIDFDISYTHARFDIEDESVNEIPGSIPLVISSGVLQRFPWDLYAALRLRYLGEYALEESGAVESGPTTLVNLRLGWEQSPAGGSDSKKGDWAAHLDFLNLFDSKDRDIAYFYESRLEPGAAVEEGIHFHPVEPFSVRVALERRF